MNCIFKMKSQDVACTPRKLQLVASLIRERSLAEALVILDHTPKKAALVFKKLLLNAQATAQHNYKLQKDSLQIEAIFVNRGQMLKRYKLLYRGRMRRQVQVQKKKGHIYLSISGQKTPAVVKKKSQETVKKGD